MSATVQTLTFDGAILQRGFWLYVWEVKRPKGKPLYYVGRTGDSSSMNAQSPYTRMGQHLGFALNSNMLRTHLENRHVKVGQCTFRLIAYGPVIREAEDRETHRARRDIVARLERELAEAMCAAGYEVMNTVNCRKPLDRMRFEQVRMALAVQFPKLKRVVSSRNGANRVTAQRVRIGPRTDSK